MITPGRTYARINTTLRGYLRLMPKSQTRPLFTGCQASVPGQTLDPEHAPIPEAILTQLKVMDKKLNTILTLLNYQSVREEFPVPVIVHDLSGAGLRFSAAQSFNIDDRVEIVLSLSPPLGLSGTIGTIVRQDIVDESSLWVVGFGDMRDTEREKIIQYVLAEQREQIRERRSAQS